MDAIQTVQAKGIAMITTRPYSETVRADLQNDANFRRALLGEVIASMVSGDTETGKSVLRTYVNGTIGFVKLGSALGKSPKSLMRMLSPTGNPHLRTFFEIVAYLQKIDNTVLTVQGIAA
jgi:DNA-binding phage protein